MKIWIIESEYGDSYYGDLTEFLHDLKTANRLERKPKTRTIEVTEAKWSELVKRHEGVDPVFVPANG